MNLRQVNGAFAWGIATALLACELGLWLSVKEKIHETVDRLRVGLITTGMLGALIMSFVPNQPRMWISLPIFLVVMVEEIIGRWLFYETLHGKTL
jgi:hypothetical protein